MNATTGRTGPVATPTAGSIAVSGDGLWVVVVVLDGFGSVDPLPDEPHTWRASAATMTAAQSNGEMRLDNLSGVFTIS